MVRKMLFAVTFAAVVWASAASAGQLRTEPSAVLACGSACTSLDVCKHPCFCFGLGGGSTTGICQPEGPAPSTPK